MILTMKEGDTLLNIIPRDTSLEIQRLIEVQRGEHTILTGYGIDGPIMSSFLERH